MHYHHVIIPAEDESLIVDLETDQYTYFLKSIRPLDLSEKDKELLIIRGLIMDGESLFKRIKKSINNESR